MDFTVSQFQDLVNKYKIEEVIDHSSRVVENSVFLLIQKESDYGIYSKYIKEAHEKKVKFIVTNKKEIYQNFVGKIEIYFTANISSIIDHSIKIFYHLSPEVILVTGTNGKSSIVSYVRQIFLHMGCLCASIGTLGVICDSIIIPHHLNSSLTTPSNLHLRQILHFLYKKGVLYVAIEASSHALHQGRLKNISSSCVCFCSFSEDHLDYHENMKNYLNSKLLLFQKNINQNSTIVLIDEVKDLVPQDIKGCHNIIIVSKDNSEAGFNQVLIVNRIQSTFYCQEVFFSYKGSKFKILSKIIGKHQMYNLLMSILLSNHYLNKLENIIKIIPQIVSPEGRMQKVFPKKNIFIDYAHNSNGLKMLLEEINSIKEARLILVFGCGGDRDKGKRRVMGKVANDLSDIVVITDDNPRNEDAKLIRKEILLGCKKAIEITPRSNAIRYALSLQKDSDVVLITGKGHENYMIYKGKVILKKTDRQIVVDFYEDVR